MKATTAYADPLDDGREFASRVAGEVWPGAHVTSIAAMRGDASTRSYARAVVSGGGAPPTIVVMILQDAAVALSSEELGVFGKDGPEQLMLSSEKVNRAALLRALKF